MAQKVRGGVKNGPFLAQAGGSLSKRLIGTKSPILQRVCLHRIGKAGPGGPPKKAVF